MIFFAYSSISLLRDKYHRQEKDAGNYAKLHLLISDSASWLLRVFKALQCCCLSLTFLTVISLQISPQVIIF